ncbi:hypothetical protein ERY430_41302 [Erythrobacter sp. EC-HK427]|nr:hypothetical protein ERY430_41302 [Erythrobacter sp. EC-HK427]
MKRFKVQLMSDCTDELPARCRWSIVTASNFNQCVWLMRLPLNQTVPVYQRKRNELLNQANSVRNNRPIAIFH